MSMAVHRTLGSPGQIRHELDLPGNLALDSIIRSRCATLP